MASGLGGFSFGWLQLWMASAFDGISLGLLLKQESPMLGSYGMDELGTNARIARGPAGLD